MIQIETGALVGPDDDVPNPEITAEIDRRLAALSSDLEQRLQEALDAKLEGKLGDHATPRSMPENSATDNKAMIEHLGTLSAQLKKLQFQVTAIEARLTSIKQSFVDDVHLKNEFAEFSRNMEQQVTAQVTAQVTGAVDEAMSLAGTVSDLAGKAAQFNDRLVGVNTRAAAVEERMRQTVDDISDTVTQIAERKLSDLARRGKALPAVKTRPMSRWPIRVAVAAAAILIGASAAVFGAGLPLPADDAGGTATTVEGSGGVGGNAEMVVPDRR